MFSYDRMCSVMQCGCDMEPTPKGDEGAARQCPVAAMVANFSKPTAGSGVDGVL